MNPTVLCVDDERDILDLLTYHLTRAGCRILTASSGREALATIRVDRPHLVLLDLMLPDIDGFGVCEILRDDPATAALPIVILSAWSSPESQRLGTEFGVLDFVRKPFNPHNLVDRLAALMELRVPATLRLAG